MVSGEMECGSSEESTNSSCRLDVRSHSLRCAIVQQCLDSGWHGITESSLTALVDVLDRYLKNMARKIAGFTELAGREEPTVQDFRLAFRDVEPAATLKDLDSFCKNVKNSPLEWDLQYPLASESEIYNSSHFSQPSSVTEKTEETEESGKPEETGKSEKSGKTRPEWMDEDLIFPQIDQEDLPRPSSEQQTSTVDDQKISAVADVIIGDDDEDIAEFQSVFCPEIQNFQTSSTVPSSPNKLGSKFSGPRTLKGISIVNGQVVPTAQAKIVPVQSRLPIELKHLKEVKINQPSLGSPDKKGKKDSKKSPVGGLQPVKKQQRISPPPVKKQRTSPPPAPSAPQEFLKIKISKSGKKEKIKSETREVSPFSPKPKISVGEPPLKIAAGEPPSKVVVGEPPSTRIRTPPEPRENLSVGRLAPRSPLPPMLDLASETLSRPPSIKLKSTLGFAEAWKKEKKDRSEKAKEKKSDKDREREREIKRELQRVKERELEAELQLAALTRPSKHKKSFDVVDSDVVAKKHKKNHAFSEENVVAMPSHLPDLWRHQQAVPPLSSDAKKSEKKRSREIESEKKHSRHFEDSTSTSTSASTSTSTSARVKKEALDQPSWTMPVYEKTPSSHETVRGNEKIKSRDNFLPENISTSRVTSQEFLPQKDSAHRLQVNPPIPKLTIPKLTLKIGGKEIKAVKSSSHSSMKKESQPVSEFASSSHAPSQSLPTPRESHYPPAVQTPSFDDIQLAAPLDLSMSSRSTPAQHTKSQKSSSKSKNVHGISSKNKNDNNFAVSQSVAVEMPRIPTPPPPVPVTVTPPKVEEVAPPIEDEINNSKIWICPPCGKPDDGSPMVGCDMCDEWYHYPCVGLLAEPTVEQWFCPSCVDKQLKKSKKSKKR